MIQPLALVLSGVILAVVIGGYILFREILKGGFGP